ncbi:MAG: dipeptidase PepE [Acidobacteria bacterium]|nr:dipeptidase PepE [Acidobacteriota bacterium]MCG3191709.1 Peptidase E [Thermoanaerobaculia bacterium]MCK6680969.1 dipeptidase PepE [Thermoanaerobaculia bacterium]
MIAPDLRLLLISNSTVFGGTYLGHVLPVIKTFLSGTSSILFVPYALKDHDGYAARARSAFESIGVELSSIHQASDPVAAVEAAEALFVGGGNTWRLLKAIQDRSLIEPVRRRVRGGMPYIGSSAGSNVSAPTIKTTNDMPIVMPASFEAFHLIPFQINPHFLDPDPNSRHMGETREERLVQYLEENDVPVAGLREGAWIRVTGGQAWLEGTTGARIFRRGSEPSERVPQDSLADLF